MLEKASTWQVERMIMKWGSSMHFETKSQGLLGMRAGKAAMAALAGLFFSGSVACTTTGRPFGEGELGSDSSPKSVVVQQAGRTAPVVSGKNRSFWLEQRQGKSTLPRLYGALATGEAESSVELARAYLAKRPGDRQGMLMLASALVLARKYDLAAYYASQVERQQPGNAEALNIKGLATMLAPRARIADFRLAVEYFKQAFDSNPNQIAAGLNLGGLLLDLGDAQGAQAVYEQASQRCGQCVAGMMGLGIAASRNRQFDKAKEAFEKVLSGFPKHAGALYHLALVYKNGYNNKKQAEKYLYAVINDPRGIGGKVDVYTKERAHAVLRSLKGQAYDDERTQLADDEKAPTTADDKEAELLLSGAEHDDP